MRANGPRSGVLPPRLPVNSRRRPPAALELQGSLLPSCALWNGILELWLTISKDRIFSCSCLLKVDATAMAFTKLLLGLAIAASLVSAKVYNTRFQNVTWDDDNWQITTTTFDQGRFQ